MTVDYAHTRTARENRERKARDLAAAASRLGLDASALAIGTGQRRRVWKAAELTHSPSEETWHAATQILRETLPAVAPPPARTRGPQSQPCRYGDGRPAALYLGGWLCTEHAPPPQPTPRPGTTLDDFRERAAARAAAVIATTRKD